MTTDPKALDRETNPPVSTIASRNLFLRDLLSAETVRESLLLELNVVSLRSNQILYEQGDKVDLVYFPVDCVLSVLAIMEDGTTVETAMIGCEGVGGIGAVLGGVISKQWLLVSISGNALQLDTRILERIFVSNESALRSLLKSSQSLMTQISQRCVCNTRHTILERLSCWLLMIHDRVGGANLRLTQEMIASRIGARRAGITVAAGMLQEMDAIEYRRGQIHVARRDVLEEAACECYRLMQADFLASPTH